jgi:hypothetical protein
MFIGHFAAGLAGRRLTPTVSLGVWFLAVQLLDVLWPFFVLAGVEHVRIDPGNTAFTPLDFTDYPVTHSLVGALIWAALLAGGWMLFRGPSTRDHESARAGQRRSAAASLLFLGVVSHWVLDVISHRPDVPVLPRGPYLGLGLWNSVPLTLLVEISMFVAAIVFYARGRRPRVSFWILMTVLLMLYLGAAFGPPPPNVTALACTAIVGLFIIMPWAWWADRERLRA